MNLDFLYKLDTVTGGRRWGEGGGTLMELYRSFYADDGAFAFTKRHDAEIMVPVIFDALKDFGLTMHVQGKTEAVFFPSAASAANPDDGNTADLIVGGGKVGYKPSFIYLGSSIHASLSDDDDCNRRISAASAAFGALTVRIFANRGVELRAKAAAYGALVLSLLFYGSEAWALSQAMRAALRSFHRRCLRTMCGYTLSMGSLVPRTAVLRPPGGGTLPSMSHTRLERMLGIPCVLMLVARRRISWVGHVLRMGEERAPRRMISSWVPTARPRGRPHLSFSQGLKKDLALRWRA